MRYPAKEAGISCACVIQKKKKTSSGGKSYFTFLFTSFLRLT